MSPTTIIAIAVPVLVVLAGVLLFAAARRRDTDQVSGVMSSETARRDRGPVQLSEQGEAAPVTGREVERAAVVARREAAAPVKVAERAPVAWVPPDEETLQVVLRQLEAIALWTANGRTPTQHERERLDMALRMFREYEMTDDVEIHALRDGVSVIHSYVEHWPNDIIASDPDNDDYL